MSVDDKPRKVVGVYERPPAADRKRPRALLIALVLLVALAWIAWYLLARG
jgi:hypothetical protein